MYSYITGIITEIIPTGITIENNGIGYFVEVANPFAYTIDNEHIIYVVQIIREDSNAIFGFNSNEQKSMFKDLISVKGIGPKTALAILAAAEPNQIKNAIIQEDTTYLQKFPKIGKKAASQIVLDLANKYGTETLTVDVSSPKLVDDTEDVLAALMALGYNKAEVTKQLKKVDKDLSTEAKIKEILKLMLKK